MIFLNGWSERALSQHVKSGKNRRKKLKRKAIGPYRPDIFTDL